MKAVASKKKAKSAGRGGVRAASKKTGKSRARPAARKKATRAAKKRTTPSRGRAATAERPAARPRAVASAKKTAAPAPGERHGEGNWKSDEEYREDLQEWSETHDAERIASEAEEDLPSDVMDDEDDDLAEGANRGSEEEPEW